MASTTNPEDWFLPELSFTDGNIATPLIDGLSYFKNLKEILQQNTSFSNLLISGWRLNMKTIIDNDENETFESLLSSQVPDFSKIKSMLWYVPGTVGDFGAAHGIENTEFTEFILDKGGQAILDNRLPKGPFASHHQKYIIVDGSISKAAFIGGIDIAPDRLDSMNHDNSVPRMEELFKAWHDIQIKLEGPCVTEAMKFYQERWNDPRTPHDFPAIGGSIPTALPDTNITQINDAVGTHSVQLLSTYACRSNDGQGNQNSYPFAQGGRFTYQNALIFAIKNAEHFIYVEDQYCWPSDVVVELGNAVDRGVVLILMLARDFDSPGLTPYHNFLRHTAIESLIKQQGDKNLVFVYHLEQVEINPETQLREQIFVHSKTMIIDDRYMVIGSGNLNRRSMKTDTEFGAAVVDKNAVDSTINGAVASVGGAILEYRKNLWSEHLGITVANDPLDSDEHPAGFPKDDALIGHVRKHVVGEPRFCNPSIIPFGLFNSNVTC